MADGKAISFASSISILLRRNCPISCPPWIAHTMYICIIYTVYTVYTVYIEYICTYKYVYIRILLRRNCPISCPPWIAQIPTQCICMCMSIQFTNILSNIVLLLVRSFRRYFTYILCHNCSPNSRFLLCSSWYKLHTSHIRSKSSDKFNLGGILCFRNIIVFTACRSIFEKE